jgi:type IV secretory pathway VirB3-like protein
MRTSTVHASLNRKFAIMGVDARVFATEAALIGIFIALQMYVFLVLIPLVHGLARWAHARDDQMVEASVKYAREKDAWDPWHHPGVLAKRPAGYGRDLPC